MTEPRSEAAHDIAIVGGGFSGLALAFRLKRHAPARSIVLLEACGRLGGKALTETVETELGRFLIESGPDSFLAAKPWAKQLAIDLGLAERLLPINLVNRPVSILKHGKSFRMPAGLSLAAPAALKPFVRSPLLSPSGRARVLREPRIRPSASETDETVGSFIRRRLGAEMLDWIAEPLMAGIYNGDPEEMSLLATFPQLRAQERRQGGLIRAARIAARAARDGPRQPAFLTLRDGVQEIVDALVMEVGLIA
jgi:oxygen-dependent protoporphyrinogen oxidase